MNPISPQYSGKIGRCLIMNTEEEQKIIVKKKFVLFGAGKYGKKALEFLEENQVAFFLDNDEKKSGSNLDGVPIYAFQDKKEVLSDYQIVLTVSDKYVSHLTKQLKAIGISSVWDMKDLHIAQIKMRVNQSIDNLMVYQRAIQWIHENTLTEKEGKSIINNSRLRKGYPEVTGYYIPSLLRWGYRELAVEYAKWLLSIQKENGSWHDTFDTSPYVFDTAQILKGLLAIRDIYPEVDDSIRRGCDWIISNMQADGRLTTPDCSAWGNGRECSEIIHLYTLSPLLDAAKILNEPHYRECAEHILSYYKKNFYEKIMDFGLLSHFYAYVMEALVDLGEVDMAREAMEHVAILQSKEGAVPAYQDVHWVCSTGLFQFAIVWYRLGEIERGNHAFSYACHLQNKTGGWYGSYLVEKVPGEKNDYFPEGEISWASKFFLDALYYRGVASFNHSSHLFLDEISSEDGRYLLLSDLMRKHSSCNSLKVLDVGCGKGRYLKRFLQDFPEDECFGMDISSTVVKLLPTSIHGSVGSLTYMPFEDNVFDFVYTCEALEHAVDIRSAIREMARVTKSGGCLTVIDKNREKLESMVIGEWEQWFDERELQSIMEEFCKDVHVVSSISYEDNWMPGLFSCWYGYVK